MEKLPQGGQSRYRFGCLDSAPAFRRVDRLSLEKLPCVPVVSLLVMPEVNTCLWSATLRGAKISF